MNWEALGAIGEVLGAVTVVATLFYLSRQIRQNSDSLERSNEYARANSIHQTNSHFGQVFAQLAQDHELASIYHKALAGEELDPTERVCFQAFVNTFCAWLENFYSQARSNLSFHGLQEDGGSDFIIATIAPYLARLLETDAGSAWWESDARHLYTTSFRGAVESTLRANGDTPSAV